MYKDLTTTWATDTGIKSAPRPSETVPFWMVVLDGKTAPAKRHATREAAEAECERLVGREGVTGYVLQSITAYVPEPRMAWRMQL